MIKKLALSVLVSAAFFSAAVTPQEVSAYSVSEANDIISTGKRYLGTRYQFGADYGQTRTFDCSSFVKTVYAKNGVYLPRSSREQAQKGYWVAKRNLKKGI